MRAFLLLFASSIFACGGGDDKDTGDTDAIDVEMVNLYADSIFDVSIEIDGDTTTVLSDERIASGDSVLVEEAVEAEQGDDFLLTVVATSLGEDHTFTAEDEIDGAALVICYDYDLATGSFGVRFGFDVGC